MSTISGVAASSVYANSATASSAVSAALAQSAATQLSVMNTLVSLGSNNNSSSPLTYDIAGLLSTLQQKPATNNATTPAQAAQNAYLQVEYAISQTLGSLASGTSSNSSGSDLASLFNLAGTPDVNNLLSTSTGPLLNTSTGNTSTQAAQFAVINAQYALTQSLTSMTSSSSSFSATA